MTQTKMAKATAGNTSPLFPPAPSDVAVKTIALIMPIAIAVSCGRPAAYLPAANDAINQERKTLAACCSAGSERTSVSSSDTVSTQASV